MRILWFLGCLVLPVLTLQKINYIDDTDPGVQYYPSPASLACHGCQDDTDVDRYGLDPRQLHNGSFSAFATDQLVSDIVGNQESGLILNFIGTALYVFAAIPNGTVSPSEVSWAVTLDSVPQAGTLTLSVGPEDGPRYNVSIYSATDLEDGRHSFNLDVKQGIIFDYAIYFSNDTDPTLTSLSPASYPTGTSSSIASSDPSRGAVSPSATPSPSSAQKNSIPAIAGSAAGGLALVLGASVGFVLFHRARRTQRPVTPDMEELGSVSGLSLSTESRDVVVPGPRPGPQDAHAVAERLRILREEVQRLEQNAGTTGSDSATLLGRSLSMMKREQTRALQDHDRRVGGGVTDILVHTDSGIMLTAGRAADELPPTYVAD
ncbi:hypothetical protein B0H19DRAFT_1259134 [Mycena capillaripes]|nr:hypothetical protein B0H19DRAFT_1259134 [Mycena capillaripes]